MRKTATVLASGANLVRNYKTVFNFFHGKNNGEERITKKIRVKIFADKLYKI